MCPVLLMAQTSSVYSDMEPLKLDSRGHFITTAYCTVSVAISLLQVTLNKLLFQRFALSRQVALLTAAHFFSTYCVVYTTMWWFSLKRKYLGIMCESKLGIVHAAFVYLSQVSLAYNSIALYQVSRLLVTPCTVLLKFVIQGEWLEGKRIIALIIIVVGCAMATISELNLQTNLVGSMALLGAIPAAALAQIWCAQYQQQLTATQFILNWTRSAGCFLFTWAILFDGVGTRVPVEKPTELEMIIIIASCGVACLVNFTGTLVIGRIDALGFQVLGCLKTILIMSAGVIFFGDVITVKMVMGCALTVVGSMMYAESIPRLECKHKRHFLVLFMCSILAFTGGFFPYSSFRSRQSHGD